MQKGFTPNHFFLKIKNSTKSSADLSSTTLNTAKSSAGFTLIEIIIYLALFSIIMSGSVVTVYQIIQNSNSLQTKVILEEEGNFILAKLNWALTGAQANTNIESPGVGISSSTLIIKTLPGNILRAQADLNNGNIRFNGGTGNLLELNPERITVTSLNFSQPVAGEIQASVTLTALSNDGKIFSRTLHITKHLRR